MLLLRLLAVHNRAAAALSCPARPVAAMAASSPPPHAGLRPAADVLTFWFGPAFANERAALSSAPYFSKETVGRWWGAGGPGFDAQCAAFADTIRAVGSGALDYGDDADGRLAAILLCDQLSRGAFRGSPEAFAYDATALRLSRAVCAAGQDAGMSAAARQFAYSASSPNIRILPSLFYFPTRSAADAL